MTTPTVVSAKAIRAERLFFCLVAPLFLGVALSGLDWCIGSRNGTVLGSTNLLWAIGWGVSLFVLLVYTNYMPKLFDQQATRNAAVYISGGSLWKLAARFVPFLLGVIAMYAMSIVIELSY